jgi:hypothetical protein
VAVSAPLDEAALAARHAGLRWIGAPLLVSGGLLFFLAATGWAQGGAAGLAASAFAGTLTALASFGVNHDTAMALAMRADPARLSPALAQEVAGERERLRRGAPELRPNVAAALILPLVCLGLQGWVTWSLFGA